MKRAHLTDRHIKALKPSADGKQYTVWDSVVPGFGARVSAKGQITYVAMRRRAGDTRPTRYSIGRSELYSLAQARDEARTALRELSEGRDPNARKAQLLMDEAARRKDTVAAVTEDFIKRHVSTLRSAEHVESLMRREILGQERCRVRDGKEGWANGKDAKWRDRPVTEIRRRDVVELVEGIADRGNRHAARLLFAHVRSMFGWAVERSIYGLDHSPASDIRITKLLGRFEPRERVLSDQELRLIWRAADASEYPYGPLVKLLLLTGQRLREIADAGWSEISGDLLVVPPQRMKSKAAHEVPFSRAVLAIIDDLPRFKGDFIFTTTGGERPVSGFGKFKVRLDNKIAELIAEDVAAGLTEKGQVEVRPWRIHDLRRTVRTRLSELRVPDMVCELVIGHTKPSLHKVYDRHKFSSEKREALELWAARLASIIEPPTDNVVKLRG